MAAGLPATDMSVRPWQRDMFDAIKELDIAQVGYVPDAGHSSLIKMCHDDEALKVAVMSTEAEGMGLAAGAWLGGERSVILMQSSGVGNCANALTLIENCRFPLLMIVTMRGEWAEFNPWQFPMSRATPGLLELMGTRVFRVDDENEAADTVRGAGRFAFDGNLSAAVLLSQKMIGSKDWNK